MFYNDQWEISLEKDASYFRECYYDTTTEFFQGAFNDYTINHINIGTGRYENRRNTGLFQYYYENGQLFCAGTFSDDKPDSIWIWYYSNGKIWQTISFTRDEFEVIAYNDSIGNSKIDAKKFIWSVQERYTILCLYCIIHTLR